MKKLPIEITIMGTKCKISCQPDSAGGTTDLTTGAIVIGGRVAKDMGETLIHEIAEYILHLQGHRYARYEDGNDGLRFIMDHHNFEMFALELTNVMRQLGAKI